MQACCASSFQAWRQLCRHGLLPLSTRSPAQAPLQLTLPPAAATQAQTPRPQLSQGAKQHPAAAIAPTTANHPSPAHKQLPSNIAAAPSKQRTGRHRQPQLGSNSEEYWETARHEGLVDKARLASAARLQQLQARRQAGQPKRVDSSQPGSGEAQAAQAEPEQQQQQQQQQEAEDQPDVPTQKEASGPKAEDGSDDGVHEGTSHSQTALHTHIAVRSWSTCSGRLSAPACLSPCLAAWLSRWQQVVYMASSRSKQFLVQVTRRASAPTQAPAALMGTFRPASLVHAARSVSGPSLQPDLSSLPAVQLSTLSLHPELHSSKVAIASSMRGTLPSQPALTLVDSQPTATPVADGSGGASADELAEGELSQALSLSRPSSSGSFASAHSRLRTAQDSPSQSPQQTARGRQADSLTTTMQSQAAEPAALAATQVLRLGWLHVPCLHTPACTGMVQDWMHTSGAACKASLQMYVCSVIDWINMMIAQSEGYALLDRIHGQTGPLLLHHPHCVHQLGCQHQPASSLSTPLSRIRMTGVLQAVLLQHHSHRQEPVLCEPDCCPSARLPCDLYPRPVRQGSERAWAAAAVNAPCCAGSSG